MVRIALIVSLVSISCLSVPVDAQTKPSEDIAKSSPVIRQLKPARTIKRLQAAPLYSFSETDVDAYLKFLSESEPDPIQRVLHLARKNIGQPYDIYLLGEFPYELHDPDPMFCLEKSDCVTFVEHTWAMALSRDWPSFFKTLQRLRYKDGKVGMVSRNHETVAEWNPNNGWLFEDATKTVAGDHTVPLILVWKPKPFFAQFGIVVNRPDERVRDSYIPRDRIESILPQTKPGDLLEIVRGSTTTQAVTHMGIIAHAADGTVNMIHSAEPAVREQAVMDYLAKNPKILGIKIFRPKASPQQIADLLMKQ